MEIRRTGSDKVFGIVNASLLFLVLIVSLYPLIYVLSASISDPYEVLKGNMVLLPKGITFSAYQRVFQHDEIMNGYRNSLYYTVVGTVINMVMTVLCAYPLSRKNLEGRGIILGFIVFTMYFSGGLVPTYLVVSRYLNLRNTIFALVLPGAISVYNMLIMRNYFVNSIPEEIHEAATIDGCSDFRLLTDVIIPLSAPVLAVIAMYYIVAHWNAWFDALIYMTKKDRYPLQLVLKNILVDGNESSMLDEDDMEEVIRRIMMSESIKYAVIVVASVPVLAIYPFIQRFFVKGVMIGAVKG